MGSRQHGRIAAGDRSLHVDVVRGEEYPEIAVCFDHRVELPQDPPEADPAVAVADMDTDHGTIESLAHELVHPRLERRLERDLAPYELTQDLVGAARREACHQPLMRLAHELDPRRHVPEDEDRLRVVQPAHVDRRGPSELQRAPVARPLAE